MFIYDEVLSQHMAVDLLNIQSAVEKDVKLGGNICELKLNLK